MSTANAPGVSEANNGGSSFFSSMSDILNGIAGGINGTRPIWDQNARNQTGQPNNNGSTFQGVTPNPTTGSIVNGTGQRDYMPLLLIGGAAILAIVLLK